MKSIIILLALISLIRVPFNYASLSLPFISFLASCTYLLPLNINPQYFKKYLFKLKILNRIKELNKRLIQIISIKFHTNPSMKSYGSTIKTDSLFYKFFYKFYSVTTGVPYKPFIFFIAMYFIIIKFGKEKNNVPYFIRYHTIHSLLIFILEFPVILLNEKLLKIRTSNSFLKMTIKNLSLTLITLNLSFIFYILFMSAMGYYVNVPILTESCRKHVGKINTVYNASFVSSPRSSSNNAV